MDKLRAAIYTRVSTEEQTKGFSLEAQEQELIAYAQRKSYKIVGIYQDGGYSGKDFNRPSFQRMMKDLREDKIDVILVWKVDRLSRNDSDVMTLIDKELTPRNKRIVLAAIDMDSSTTIGRLFISLLGVFANYERAVIIDRVSSGMDQRAKQGYSNGGQVLGYDSINGELVINNEEAEIVKLIFEMRANYHGYKAIATRLNELGYRTKRNNEFQINSVKTILNSPLYIGKISWGKYRDYANKRRRGKQDPEIYDGRHEPIISQELWDRVQLVNDEFNRKYKYFRENRGRLLLNGIIRCPECGASTVFSKTKNKYGKEYHYYMCQRYHNGGKTVCRPNVIRKDIIEPKVLTLLKNLFLLDKELLKEITQSMNDENSKVNDEEKILEKQQKRLMKLVDQENKLDNSYIEGKIDIETYNRLSQKITEEKNNIKATISKIDVRPQSEVYVSDEIVKRALENFEEIFNKASYEEKRELIRTVFDEINVTKDRKELKDVTITFSNANFLPYSEIRGTVS